MKKIDKIDMFLFVCIVLGVIFGLATILAQWIVGTEILWLKGLAVLSFCFPTITLTSNFASEVLAKIINNHKEKKKGKNNEKK